MSYTRRPYSTIYPRTPVRKRGGRAVCTEGRGPHRRGPTKGRVTGSAAECRGRPSNLCLSRAASTTIHYLRLSCVCRCPAVLLLSLLVSAREGLCLASDPPPRRIYILYVRPTVARYVLEMRTYFQFDRNDGNLDKTIIHRKNGLLM